MNNIKVSIICNAYNHEKYIAEALESFVNQKTNFEYEILVHDDASTDHTAEIIRRYEEKYPHLIKAIYQNENQYSKQNGALYRAQYGRVSGKYIAFCEGDDCWCDCYKLQKQYDVLERHPEIDMCAHRANFYDCIRKKVSHTFPDVYAERILTADEVIYGEGGYLATNSLFYRASLLDNTPPFKKFWNIDYTVQIQGSLRGGIYFLPDIMSTYRYMTEGSWSQRTYNDLNKYDNMYNKKQQMLDILNDDTNGIYSKIIELCKLRNEFVFYLTHGNYKECLSSRYRQFIKELNMIVRIKIYAKRYMPFLYRIKRKFINIGNRTKK